MILAISPVSLSASKKGSAWECHWWPRCNPTITSQEGQTCHPGLHASKRLPCCLWTASSPSPWSKAGSPGPRCPLTVQSSDRPEIEGKKSFMVHHLFAHFHENLGGDSILSYPSFPLAWTAWLQGVVWLRLCLVLVETRLVASKRPKPLLGVWLKLC